MKTIEIECYRTVHYAKNIELTDEQADAFQQALESKDKQRVQEMLDGWIDTRYDVTDAEEYGVLNVSIDDEPLYF